MTLSAITSELGARLGIATSIVPMSDDPVRTEVRTAEGWLSFQHYFVRKRCEPEVQEIRFEGASQALPSKGVIDALNDPDLSAIVICPSNPFLSIDPIMAIPGLRRQLAEAQAPVVAVSPVIAGQSVKGPTAKIMKELGLECSTTVIARLYQDIIDGIVIDDADAAQTGAITALGIQVSVTNTLMQTLDDRIRLAENTLRLADRLAVTLETTEGVPGSAEV
jgi:LPPG:FO 2-phospho-L-lactate transferase